MALLVKQGTLAVPASLGTQSITTVGFQGKFGIFFHSLLKTGGFGADRNFGYGFVDAAGNARSVSHGAKDNITTPTDPQRRQQSNVLINPISHNGSFGTLPFVASFVSWDSLGFTLNWTDILAGFDAVVVGYLILGGSDLTDTWVGDISTPTVTGLQSYTAPNFQPDLLLTVGYGDSTTIPSNNSGVRIMLGAATDPAAQFSIAAGENSSVPTSVYSNASPKIIQVQTATADKFVASLDSMDALGYTLNWTTVNPTSGSIMVAALKGGSYFVGTDTQKTSTGTKQRTGVGFPASAAMFLGSNLVAPGTLDVVNSKLSVGMTDGVNEAAVWGSGTDAASPTDENSYLATDGCLVHASNPSTLDAKATLDSFGSDDYTLDWITADGNAREFISVLMGNVVSGGGPVTDEAALRQGLSPLRWR